MSALGLIKSAALLAGLVQATGTASTPPFSGFAVLIETRAQAESAFKDDIVRRGLFAVVLRLTSAADGASYTFRRPDLVVQTELDARIPALEPQRAYDRLMRKIGGGPFFAEAGLARAITEGSRKKKLRHTILEKALGESTTVGAGREVAGHVFFEIPKDVTTLRYSTLVIEEIVNEKTGERSWLRLPLTTEPAR